MGFGEAFAQGRDKAPLDMIGDDSWRGACGWRGQGHRPLNLRPDIMIQGLYAGKGGGGQRSGRPRQTGRRDDQGNALTRRAQGPVHQGLRRDPMFGQQADAIDQAQVDQQRAIGCLRLVRLSRDQRIIACQHRFDMNATIGVCMEAVAPRRDVAIVAERHGRNDRVRPAMRQ